MPYYKVLKNDLSSPWDNSKAGVEYKLGKTTRAADGIYFCDNVIDTVDWHGLLECDKSAKFFEIKPCGKIKYMARQCLSNSIKLTRIISYEEIFDTYIKELKKYTVRHVDQLYFNIIDTVHSDMFNSVKFPESCKMIFDAVENVKENGFSGACFDSIELQKVTHIAKNGLSGIDAGKIYLSPEIVLSPGALGDSKVQEIHIKNYFNRPNVVYSGRDIKKINDSGISNVVSLFDEKELLLVSEINELLDSALNNQK